MEKNKHNTPKCIYGVNHESGDIVEFDSIYKACVTLTGKTNSGLICKSLNYKSHTGRPIIAYGYEWFYKDSVYDKQVLEFNDNYKKIPKELQKKRGPKKTHIQHPKKYRCYVYDNNFNIINKFEKIQDCVDYYGLTYKNVSSRVSNKLNINSKYPRFVNCMYFQKEELQTDTIEHFKCINKKLINRK